MDPFGIRSIGSTLQGADKISDNTPFMPQAPILMAPSQRNVAQIASSQAGGFGKTNIRYEIPKTEGEELAKVWLCGELAALPTPSGGTATLARFCDYIGIAMIREIRIRYGTETLQTIRKEDLFCHQNLYLTNDAQLREDVNVHGNVHPPKRVWEARRPIWFKAAIHPAFFQQELSNALKVQGLTQKLAFDFDFEPATSCIQVDGTSSNIFLSDGASYFNSLTLQAEFYHVLRKERDMGVKLMSAPQGLRYLFDGYQWASQVRVASTEALDGGVYSFELKNLNMPTKTLIFMLRWQNDVNRTASASGPSDNYGTNGVMGGADWFNVSGWVAPLRTPVADSYGPATPLFTHLAIKSGSHYIVRKTPVWEILNDWQGRFYQGQPGLGLLVIPLCHLPTLPNSATSFLDFSVIDNPTVELTKSSSPNGGYANVGAYANADIGDSSSALIIDVAAVTLSNADVQDHDLHRPF